MMQRVITACALAVVWAAVPAAAATYYLSPTGNNSSAGTSPDQAWQSIARVNGHDFEPGDQVLFEGGHTFSGNVYFDAADAGTPAQPVVVSSYGNGRATIYAGNGGGILGYNTAGFHISELYVVGSGRDTNTESGILFFTDLPGDVLLDGLTIDHVDSVRFGDYGVEIGGNAGRSGYRNVRIAHVIASENGLGGIFTYARQRAVHRNVYVGYSSAFLNAGFSGLLYNSGNGLTLSGVDGAIIERSVAHDNGWRSDASNGPVGIWTFNSNNVVIQFNESYNNLTGGTKDGGGFSLDNSTSNSVLQYNYAHGNAGAGYMLAHKWNDYVHTGNVIRWNISENDARKNQYASIQTWGRIVNAEIYNNTIYIAYNQGGQRAIYVRNRSIEAQDPERLHFRNNILQTKGGVPLVAVDSSAADNAVDLRFEGNLYWPTGGSFRIYWKGTTYSSLSAWRTASGQERLDGKDIGLSADPQLMAAGAGSSFNNALMIEGAWQYRLLSTSPAVDAGLDLSRFGVAVGSRDFFGGASLRHFGRDIGAHEFYVSCNWTLTPTSATLPPEGGGAPVDVWAASDDCGWAALPAAAWAGMSPETGRGPMPATAWAAANPGAARSTTIRVANQTFTLTQEGSIVDTLPPGWSSSDIGAVGVAGEALFDGATYTLRGSGADVWGTADAFHYAYQQVDGDWEIEAQVKTVENVAAWTKVGVMIRNTLEPGSSHGAMLVSAGKGLAFQYRPQAGGSSYHISGGSGTAPYWVRLVRRGTTLSAYRRAPSEGTWTHVGDATVALGPSVYIGLFVCSQKTSQLATGTFDNVTARDLDAPSGEDIVLWAAEAPVVKNWTITTDAGAAGGSRLQNANAGAAKIVTALAEPTQYFEMTFHAIHGRGYRLWMRGKATSNSASNDSVHVQFDKSVDVSGNPVARIGTTGMYEWNLEDCSGCGLSGWGWQDNGWGVGVLGPLIYFESTGTQRIRVQVREDGVGLDQIVLSSVQWVNGSPGALKNDTTILAKQ